MFIPLNGKQTNKRVLVCVNIVFYGHVIPIIKRRGVFKFFYGVLHEVDESGEKHKVSEGWSSWCTSKRGRHVPSLCVIVGSVMTPIR